MYLSIQKHREMFKEVKELINLFSENTSNPILLGIFSLIAFFLYLVRSSLKKVIERIRIIPYIAHYFSAKKELEALHNIKDLKDHDVFIVLDDLSNMSFEFFTQGQLDEFKVMAFEKFLKRKMKSTAEHLLEIVNATNKNMKPQKLKNLIFEKFSKCNCNLKRDMRKDFLEAGVSIEEINFVMAKFDSVREAAMLHYEKTIENVFKDRSLVSNYILLTVVFHVIANEGLKMVDDCRQVFDAANGSFLKVKYGKKQ
jgi:hypothetical protein